MHIKNNQTCMLEWYKFSQNNSKMILEIPNTNKKINVRFKKEIQTITNIS